MARTEAGCTLLISQSLRFFPDHLGSKLSAAWEKEVEKKRKKKKTPSLLKASMNVFGWRLATLGLVLFILEIGFR